jgi:hypothetical protein
MGTIVAFAATSVLTPQFACALGNGRGKSHSVQRGNGAQAFGNQGGRLSGAQGLNSSGGSLMPAQVEQLIRMREEEKLAHDVYVTLAQTSGLQIFNNIANAESQHMRAVEQLVSRYSPAIAGPQLPVGSFSNPQFQSFYKSLVASGSTSPFAAATVGAKIEEMDIKDLQTMLSQNLPQDISRVLEHLQKASGNHLRAFSMELNRLGATYTPEFLVRRSTTVSSAQTTIEDNQEWGKGMRRECTEVLAHLTRTITQRPLNHRRAKAIAVQGANKSLRPSPTEFSQSASQHVTLLHVADQSY